MSINVTFNDLSTLVGKSLGSTEYREITQEQINLFADATDDHQWIHVDVERANAGPFGAPIAHGYLTLALLIPFFEELLQVEGVTTKVNYGLDKVRFPAAVRVGDRVRMSSTVREITQVSGGVHLVLDNVIDVEGGAKPAVVATSLFRLYP